MTALIARERELAAAARFLEAPSPRGLLFGGEAGIGKTALWSTVADLASARGARVLVAKVGEHEQRLSLSVLADLVAPIFGATAAALPARQRRVLAAALGLGEGEIDERLLSIAVENVLQAGVAETHVVMAIDDAQWVDAASASILRYAVRRVPVARLRVIATARGDASLTIVPSRDLDHVLLDSLTEESVAEIVRARSERPISTAALRRIVTASGGNPLFALELARSHAEEGVASGAPAAIPETLRDLLDGRLQRLAPAVRHVLAIVAAAAQPTVELVEEVGGLAARAALKVAAKDGLVEFGQGRIRFAHPLLAEAAYAGETPSSRLGLHARLAEAVIGEEERAGHLAAATVLPDEGVAATLEAAAARARRRGGVASAAGLLDDSIRLTPQPGPAATRRTLSAADDHWRLGHTEQARMLLEPLVAALESTPDRARALRMLARAKAYEVGFPAATVLLREALEHVGASTGLRAVVERDLAMAIVQYGALEEAATHAQHALSFAHECANEPLAQEVAIHAGAIAYMQGRVDPSLVEARAPPTTDDESGVLRSKLVHGALLKWSDRFDDARRTFVPLYAELLEREEEGALAPVAFHLGELECWTGDLDAAERYAHESLDAARLARQVSTEALGRYLLALVAASRGEETARSEAEAALAAAEASGDMRHMIRNRRVLGFFELSGGDARGAVRYLLPAYDLLRRIGHREVGFYRFEPDLVEALLLTGERERASMIWDDFAARVEQTPTPWGRAVSARGRALLDAANGDLQSGLEAAAAAVKLSESLPLPLDRARAVFVRGTLERRARRKRAASDSLKLAVAMFAEQGARRWAQRAAAEGARIGGRAPAPAGLTATEQRVADLVAVGRANKEVASELFMSVKTVEANLSRIFRKLDVRSRTELAARLTHGDP